MGTLYLRVNLEAMFLLSHQAPAEQSKPTSSNAEAHTIICVLHHEQNGHVVSPARQDQRLCKIDRMCQHPAKKFQNADRHADVGIDQRRGQEAHEPGDQDCPGRQGPSGEDAEGCQEDSQTGQANGRQNREESQESGSPPLGPLGR